MTFSIVARDPRSGAFGVATATGGPVVGSLVPHARAGVGAIATQAYTNPLYGFQGLELLANTMAPTDVLGTLTAADAGRARRQCIVIGKSGPPAGWTGDEVNSWCGHKLSDDYAVAGNLLAGPEVIGAMFDSLTASAGENLEDRLLEAMKAGEAQGGDNRGIRSAALKVYTTEPYPAIDIRADLSDAPLEDLGRILASVRDEGYAGFFRQVPRLANQRDN